MAWLHCDENLFWYVLVPNQIMKDTMPEQNNPAISLIFQWWLLLLRAATILVTCSRVSSILPEFSITYWAFPHFTSKAIWEAIRFLAWVSVRFPLSISRTSCMSSSLQTICLEIQWVKKELHQLLLLCKSGLVCYTRLFGCTTSNIKKGKNNNICSRSIQSTVRMSLILNQNCSGWRANGHKLHVEFCCHLLWFC